MNKLTMFLAAWAVAASLCVAWLVGRNSVTPSTSPAVIVSTPPRAAMSPRVPEAANRVAIATTPTAMPSGAADAVFPQYVSSVPKAFRGNWDEMVADKCEGRESRFYFGEHQFNNFEVGWEVTKVKLYSPNEMDMSTTMKDEAGNQNDQVWEFKLTDGGKTLTGRKKGALFFRKCPAA